MCPSLTPPVGVSIDCLIPRVTPCPSMSYHSAVPRPCWYSGIGLLSLRWWDIWREIFMMIIHLTLVDIGSIGAAPSLGGDFLYFCPDVWWTLARNWWGPSKGLSGGRWPCPTLWIWIWIWGNPPNNLTIMQQDWIFTPGCLHALFHGGSDST